MNLLSSRASRSDSDGAVEGPAFRLRPNKNRGRHQPRNSRNLFHFHMCKRERKVYESRVYFSRHPEKIFGKAGAPSLSLRLLQGQGGDFDRVDRTLLSDAVAVDRDFGPAGCKRRPMRYRGRTALKRRVKRSNQATPGCPISRVLCEKWGVRPPPPTPRHSERSMRIRFTNPHAQSKACPEKSRRGSLHCPPRPTALGSSPRIAGKWGLSKFPAGHDHGISPFAKSAKDAALAGPRELKSVIADFSN